MATKNFAFLMVQSGKWSLSTGYDICHAYRPGSMWVSAQSLMINGKREGISNADFLEVARKMNIKKPEEKIEQVKILVQRWIELAKETGVEVKLPDSIQATLLVAGLYPAGIGHKRCDFLGVQVHLVEKNLLRI